MRSFLFGGIAALSISFVVGCAEAEPTVVTTSEDEIAAYEAMIEADQEQTEADEAAEAEGGQ